MLVGLILGNGIAGTILLSFNFEVNSNIPLVTGLLYSANDDKESRVFCVSPKSMKYCSKFLLNVVFLFLNLF